ncbi:nuclear transcription factor Y subunit beta-like [Oncorhynchus keta]|uniref:nuclear transcription factor Y subunit beta-like n=1 Tax=Oncorhynchus keta TaxID=8018 RepID=UPI00227BBE74|nr:nuclear transcription factor Y subunit beta-like [Oncorhynchus keta]
MACTLPLAFLVLHGFISLSAEENPYRITHQPRTKRRGKQRQQQQQQQEKRQVQQEQQQQQQRQQQQWERLHYLDKWTWEEILDGKGPWAEPGEYCRPKAELEAAKAEAAL